MDLQIAWRSCCKFFVGPQTTITALDIADNEDSPWPKPGRRDGWLDLLEERMQCPQHCPRRLGLRGPAFESRANWLGTRPELSMGTLRANAEQVSGMLMP